MKVIGKAKITATDIIGFPKGTIVEIGMLSKGEETASGADAEDGDLIAYQMDWKGNSHDVDVTEEDFKMIDPNFNKSDLDAF